MRVSSVDCVVGKGKDTYLGGLLEGLLVDGDEDDGVRAEAVTGGSLDVLDEVGALCKVDKVRGAELGQAHFLLLVARVDADDVETHGLCVLAGEGAETSTGADDGDGLAGAGARLLESLVDGDAGAQDGGDGGKVALFGDAGDVGGLGDAVLLKGAVDGVAGQEGLGAEGLVGGLAEVTCEAGAVDPLLMGSSAGGTNKTSGEERRGSRRTLTPAWSPISMSSTSSPRATTIPAPSWPPTSGNLVGRGQSLGRRQQDYESVVG